MIDSMSEDEELQKKFIRNEMKRIITELEESTPQIPAKIGAMTGAGLGTASTLGATSLWSGAGVGLSGIKAGLLLLGGIAGGGLAVGMAAVVAPAAACSFAGYHFARRRNKERYKQAYLTARTEFSYLLDQLKGQEDLLYKEISAINDIIVVLEESILEFEPIGPTGSQPGCCTTNDG
jgi:hypothetical protein